MADNLASVKTGIPVVQYQGGEVESVNTFSVIGTTTNPTTGSGATFLRTTVRDGSYAWIHYELLQANAGTAGSGDYVFPIPANLSIDYTRANALSTVTLLTGCIGYGLLYSGTTQYNVQPCVLNNGAYVNRIVLELSSDAVNNATMGSATAPLSTATTRLSFTVRVPIVGWDTYVAYGAGQSAENRLGLVRAGTMPGLTGGQTVAANNVGEIIRAGLAVSSAAGLSTGTQLTIVNITVTPGDWDITGAVGFRQNATSNVTEVGTSISKTPGTLSTGDTRCNPTAGEVRMDNLIQGGAAGGTFDRNYTFPSYRYSTTVSQQLNLVVFATFTGSGATTSAYGFLEARRRV